MVVDSVMNVLGRPNQTKDVHGSELQKKGFITSRKNSEAVVTNSQIKALEKVRESPVGIATFGLKNRHVQNTQRVKMDSKRTLYSRTKKVQDITVKINGINGINETIETRSINQTFQIRH